MPKRKAYQKNICPNMPLILVPLWAWSCGRVPALPGSPYHLHNHGFMTKSKKMKFKSSPFRARRTTYSSLEQEISRTGAHLKTTRRACEQPGNSRDHCHRISPPSLNPDFSLKFLLVKPHNGIWLWKWLQPTRS